MNVLRIKRRNAELEAPLARMESSHLILQMGKLRLSKFVAEPER